MGQKHLPTARPPRRAPGRWRTDFAIASVCVCVCSLSTQGAYCLPDRQRTTHYALSPNGAIGALLLAGPCEDLGKTRPTLQPGYQDACPSTNWHVLSNSSGDFDWASVLGLPPNTPAAAVAGAFLYLERPFDGWLFVAADGVLRVAVDGRWVHRRDVPRQRGQAFVPIALQLDAGFHPFLLGLERSANRANLSVLLRERQTNQAPSDALIYLPGGPSERRLIEQQLALSLRVGSMKVPLELEARLSFPSGAPTRAYSVEVELRQTGNQQTRLWKPGTFAVDQSQHGQFIFHLGSLDSLASDDQSTLEIRLADAVITRKLWITPDAITSLERAVHAQALPAVQASATSRHDALGATLQAYWSEVTERMLQPLRKPLSESLRRLEVLTTDLEQGRTPAALTGFVDAFIRSPFDGRPTSVMTYVPVDYRPDESRSRPLVVALHGYNGTPRRILDAFLDVENLSSRTKLDGFVLAPAAHGNSFYRGPGEYAVLDAIDWATATYPIDRTRISITGVSMGGTGAAEIAFHHSQLFAAAAPLCGYHSYFVRRDTANKPLRTWERQLMHRFSPASWAESGNDIPLFVAHGTKDRPLENSKSLTTRYHALGYNLVEDWPDLGHAVWKKTYHRAAMYQWLTKWQKDEDPTRVVLASSSLASGKKFWLELTQLVATEAPSVLDGRIVSPTQIEIKSRGVAAFRIGDSRHLDREATLQIDIDGTSLAVPSGTERRFAKVDGQWQTARAQGAGIAATRRVEGPWSELFSAPVAVVYGSVNPNTTALNREIATRLVEPRAGVDLHIPVISDAEFSPETSPLTRLIYVGRPDNHRHLAKIHAALPIRVTHSAIELGRWRFEEPDAGVAFLYPDPNRGERLLGVISGNGSEGLWRFLALPVLLPDFVVFDQGADAAAGEQVLGLDAFVRAAGFFRADWSLPEDLLDPFAPQPR
jgi:poly(3-hydroxybutyrate) depolymerase